MVVTITHIGIETEYLQSGLASSAVNSEATALKQKHAGKILIGGIDPTQRLSGIALKLLAFEQLISLCPVWKDQVVLGTYVV